MTQVTFKKKLYIFFFILNLLLKQSSLIRAFFQYQKATHLSSFLIKSKFSGISVSVK